MAQKTYHAIKVAQRPGVDPFFLLSCPATEILEWADAPRKRADVRAGYQRDLDPGKVSKIAEFLKLDASNILPSAVLIALRTDSYKVEAVQDDLVQIVIALPETDAEACRAALRDELLDRLTDTERAAAEDLDSAEDSAEEDALQEAQDPESSSDPPPSYFAALTAEVLRYPDLPLERRKQIDDFALSYAKPGLILDGQHRVFGAKEYEDGGVPISLPIVLLPGIAPAEQVFQFYVLNNTAKPLEKRQLRSIISTSLSAGEIATLYKRFDQVGVDPEQAQWTYRVNTDSDSPFLGLVNFGLRGENAPLNDNVMDQVVSQFVKLPKRYHSLTKGVDEWAHIDYRLALFYAFWSSVRDMYPGAWDQGVRGEGQLFYKVSLLKLQEFVLEYLKSALEFLPASPFSSPERLQDDVKRSLGRLPEEFFLREWKVKSLDTRDGHDFFLKQIREVVEADGKNLGNRRLFKATN